MVDVSDYENLCTRVNTIITRRNLKIRVDTLTLTHEIPKKQYNFIIYDDNSEIVQLTSYYSDGQVLQGTTRGSYENLQTKYVFNITWLITLPEYQGQKLALLILIYSICYLKTKHVNIIYVTLDDDSDNNFQIKKNIYNKIGFVYRDHLSLTSKNTLKIYGPEKQLLLDENFKRRANNLLSEIESLPVESLLVMRGGKYTVKELKYIAIINNIKITKKLDKKTVSLNKNDLIKKLKNIIN